MFFHLKENFSKIATKILAKKKFILVAIVFLIVFVGVFAPAGVGAEAEEQSKIVWFVGLIVSLLVGFFGWALLKEVGILISFAQYNDFVNSTAVTTGWVIVRDLCNMFFIVVLLVIAIATILKIEMYHYKKLLGRLIIMAILINFSKTICGVIIDFAQVLMMTFVNGFSAAAGGNFVEALKLKEMMEIAPTEEGISNWDVLAGYLLALVMTIVSCVVVGVMIVIFLMRMIMLWILIVLSPLAYLLSTFPQGQKYAGQWWSQFGNYVIVGPVLAFFLWLSLLSVTTLSSADQPPLPSTEGGALEERVTSEASKYETLIPFIIAIGMLVGGLVITQQMGVMGSTLAGGAVAGMRKYGMAAVKKPVSLAGKGLRAGYSYAGERIQDKTGLEIRPGEYIKSFKEHREYMKARRKVSGLAKAEKMAAGGVMGRLGLMFTGSREGAEMITSPLKAAKFVTGGHKKAKVSWGKGLAAERKARNMMLRAKNPFEMAKAEAEQEETIAKGKITSAGESYKEAGGDEKVKEWEGKISDLTKDKESEEEKIKDIGRRKERIIRRRAEGIKREKPELTKKDAEKQAKEEIEVEITRRNEEIKKIDGEIEVSAKEKEKVAKHKREEIVNRLKVEGGKGLIEDKTVGLKGLIKNVGDKQIGKMIGVKAEEVKEMAKMAPEKLEEAIKEAMIGIEQKREDPDYDWEREGFDKMDKDSKRFFMAKHSLETSGAPSAYMDAIRGEQGEREK